MGLIWNEVPAATEYQVLISENNDLSDPLIKANTTEVTYTPLGLSNAKTYYWQIFALDVYENTGIGSPIWSFSINSNHANELPVAQITALDEGSIYTASDTVVFAGSGNDREDGELSGASLKWRSDVDGDIGTGNTFSSRILVAGVHQITLTATDSAGAKGVDSVSISIPAGRIPDTGQTGYIGYEPGEGSDPDYSINPPAYTKLDASGIALDVGATEWAMVRDDVTGLIWEVKSKNEGVHDKDKKYLWQNINSGFIDKLNSTNFGGNSDWRLPTIQELYSLLHNIEADPDPKIDMTYFPNTLTFAYWSSTVDARNSSKAWYVSFAEDGVDLGTSSQTHYVRAVRGAQKKSELVADAYTATDPATGLMWEQVVPDPDFKTWMRWGDALHYCETLELAGYNDWRLPTAKELQSIVDYEKTDPPAIDETIFRYTKPHTYWSSTVWTKSNESFIDAWVVSFENGKLEPDWESDFCGVRAVRVGK